MPNLKSSALISLPARQITMDTKSKKTKLKKVCDLSKIKTRPDDGRKYYIINRKPISSSTYEVLIEKLYKYFFGINATTMESYFEVWME